MESDPTAVRNAYSVTALRSHVYCGSIAHQERAPVVYLVCVAASLSSATASTASPASSPPPSGCCDFGRRNLWRVHACTRCAAGAMSFQVLDRCADVVAQQSIRNGMGTFIISPTAVREVRSLPQVRSVARSPCSGGKGSTVVSGKLWLTAGAPALWLHDAPRRAARGLRRFWHGRLARGGLPILWVRLCLPLLGESCKATALNVCHAAQGRDVWLGLQHWRQLSANRVWSGCTFTDYAGNSRRHWYDHLSRHHGVVAALAGSTSEIVRHHGGTANASAHCVGYYLVNWDQAGQLSWGYDAGCDFAMRTCADFMQQHPDQPWFLGASGAGCTSDRCANCHVIATRTCPCATAACIPHDRWRVQATSALTVPPMHPAIHACSHPAYACDLNFCASCRLQISEVASSGLGCYSKHRGYSKAHRCATEGTTAPRGMSLCDW